MMRRSSVHISHPINPGIGPRDEICRLLQSYCSGGEYVPSDPIPLGLFFMLNRGDTPKLEPLRLAVESWLERRDVQDDETVREAYEMLQRMDGRKDRGLAPHEQFLERVLRLYAREGNELARDLLPTYLASFRSRIRERMRRRREHLDPPRG